MSDDPEAGADGEQADEGGSRFGAIADRIADRRARAGAEAEPTSNDRPDERAPDADDADAGGSSESASDAGGSNESDSDAGDERPVSGESPADGDSGADSARGSRTDGRAVDDETPAAPAREEPPILEQLTERGTRALTLVDTGREDPWSFLGGESTLRGKQLLVVSVGEPSPGLRRIWETAEGADRRGLVQVGDVPPAAEPYDERFADVVKRVPSRSNVSRLGIIVSQVATRFADRDGETIVVIDSFTELAARTTTQTLFRFGYLLESQFSSHGIHGFCGLAEQSHSEAELTTLAELFDTAVESTGDGVSLRQVRG